MSRYRQPYTLFKRGKFWYYKTYDDRGIRTCGKSTGCTSKNAAKDFCNKLYLSGSLFTTERKFSEYAKHFFDDNAHYVKDRIEPLAENSLKGYRTKLNNYLLPYFGNMKLSDINYSKLKAFRIEMLEKYAPSNVVGTMSTLKQIINCAYRDRLIAVNPFDFLEPLNVSQKERDAFTLDEVIYFYNEIADEFKKTVLLIALTGMRISEAVGVTDHDVKTSEKGNLYIDLQQQFNLKKYKKLKTKYARVIPITPEIKELIGFDNMRLSAFYREFTRIKPNFQNADERKLSFHSLRHFFITNTKAQNVNDVKVEFIAGHTLKGQQKVYTNFKIDDLIDVVPWQQETYNIIKKNGSEPTEQNQIEKVKRYI